MIQVPCVEVKVIKTFYVKGICIQYLGLNLITICDEHVRRINTYFEGNYYYIIECNHL